MATAMRLAVCATALLMPEATPARSCDTELSTTVVKGATLIAIPKPVTVIGMRKPNHNAWPNGGHASIP